MLQDQPAWPRDNHSHDSLRGRAYVKKREEKTLCFFSLFKLEATIIIGGSYEALSHGLCSAQFQKFDGQNRIMRFLNTTDAFAHDVDLYIRDLFTSLTDRA